MSILLYGCTTWTLTKRMAKSLMATTQECCAQYQTSPGGSTPQNSSCTATYHPSRKLSNSDDADMRDTASHERTKAWRPARTYIQQLCAGTGCSFEDLPEAMDDREGWRERARNIRAEGATWWWWWWHSLNVKNSSISSYSF